MYLLVINNWMQLHNGKYLKETRRALRNDLTPAEAALWNLLKNNKLEGRKFRRQHSIKNYIVDFYCPSAKLIIELDGSAHDNLGQSNADYLRDQDLNKLGYKVLRFENDLIFNHPDEVVNAIKAELSVN